MMDVTVGQVWRSKKDGTEVKVLEVSEMQGDWVLVMRPTGRKWMSARTLVRDYELSGEGGVGDGRR